MLDIKDFSMFSYLRRDAGVSLASIKNSMRSLIDGLGAG